MPRGELGAPHLHLHCSSLPYLPMAVNIHSVRCVMCGWEGRWEAGREKESDSKQMDVAKDSERQIKREGEAAATTLEQEASGGRTG